MLWQKSNLKSSHINIDVPELDLTLLVQLEINMQIYVFSLINTLCLGLEFSIMAAYWLVSIKPHHGFGHRFYHKDKKTSLYALKGPHTLMWMRYVHNGSLELFKWNPFAMNGVKKVITTVLLFFHRKAIALPLLLHWSTHSTKGDRLSGTWPCRSNHE